MKITLILTTYNQEKFIEQAMLGALQQKLRDIEILVVDDGSTDGTDAIVRSFERRGVRYFRKPNGGPSSAINLGLQNASGELIALSSGDDVLMPGALAKSIALLKKHRVDFVASQPTIIDANGELIDEYEWPSPFRAFEDCSSLGWFRELFYAGNFICAPSVVGCRDMFRAVGDFNEALLQLQDYDYWLRATAAGFRAHIFPSPVLKYRRHDKNISVSQNNKRLRREYIFVLRAISRLLDSESLKTVLYRDIGAAMASSLTKEQLLPHLYLSHADEAVRDIGLEMLLEQMGDPVGQAAQANAYGLTTSHLFSLTAM